MKLLLLIPLLLASCTFANKDTAVALGGRGSYAGRDFSLVWDNEGSFRDAAVVAGLAVGAVQAVALQKSADALTTATVKEGTKVQLGAQQLEATKAGFEHAETIHSTVNPNLPPQ
jgi:putative NIF3 family GTP cyclohydrolase 1 type 2